MYVPSNNSIQLNSNSIKLTTGQITAQQGCEPAVSLEKTHSWNQGYIGKLIIDQTWLSQQTQE